MSRPRPLVVAGMMSGTSADGIDVALVEITPKQSGVALHLLAHRAWPFAPALRAAVLAAQDARRISTAELARLHWRLGLAYAKAYGRTVAAHPAEVQLVGCHGQTIYHQGAPVLYAGERFRCTWQIGEMAPLAQAAGVPVVSNFRPADMAVGGQGAPLVPLLDVTLYRHRSRTRLLQNIGGIGNVTAVPPAGSDAPADARVVAFDTGPGNMVIDALMQQLYDKPYDRGGRIAASGKVLEGVVRTMLRAPLFRKRPPRSLGREEFGPHYAADLLRACRHLSRAPEDAIATATALTARSIHDAIERFVPPAGAADLIVSGGGARNQTLLATLRTLFAGRAEVLTSDDPSLPEALPVEAKEAVAFALLAWMSFHRRPGNVPSATGATAAAVLGQITCA